MTKMLPSVSVPPDGARPERPDTLSVEDVMGIRMTRSLYNHDMYKDILQNCYDKIIWAARRGHSQATFFIRPVQFDRPLINTRNAFNYIKDKLDKGGFTVNHMHDTHTYLLIISWPLERSELLKQWIQHNRVTRG